MGWSNYTATIMWCSSGSLSVWANAWLTGHAGPDDVLDALTAWAPKHSIVAYDAVTAGRTGLPFPDADSAGSLSVLQTIRTAAGGPAGAAIGLVLPVPGDVRGLTVGTAFARDALAAGEAMLITSGAPAAGERTTLGLVPEYCDETTEMCWTVHTLSGQPPGEQHELGAAEYDLRSAVRAAAELLGALDLQSGSAADPRELVEQLLDDTRRHRIPDHAPDRAVRVLEQAAHVAAILTASAESMPTGIQSFSQTRIADDALRPLAAVVRTARLAAVDAILRSAGPG